jgi:mRNA interferase RelE/StbE
VRENGRSAWISQGTTGYRLGDFRVVFEETEVELIITKIGPRGSVYD